MFTINYLMSTSFSIDHFSVKTTIPIKQSIIKSWKLYNLPHKVWKSRTKQESYEK